MVKSMLNSDEPGHSTPEENMKHELTAAAKRALSEAEARRQEKQASRPKEINGRKGPEPVRFGDWEVKGIASDF